MANKLFLGVLVAAMLASAASASRFMDTFIDFANDPSKDTLVRHLYNQAWFFVYPIAAGPLAVVLSYMFNEVEKDVDVDGETLTLQLGELLGFYGAGNFNIFFDLMTGMFYKYGLS